MMKRLGLGLMLALLSGTVVAAWVPVDKTIEAVSYLDATTIRKNGEFRRVWVLLDLLVRGPDGQLSVRALAEYDCKEERARFLYVSTHSGPMATGKIRVSGSNKSSDWHYIAPRTV
jgi:hypothetical protein